MRIRDWSSDVCSSDPRARLTARRDARHRPRRGDPDAGTRERPRAHADVADAWSRGGRLAAHDGGLPRDPAEPGGAPHRRSRAASVAVSCADMIRHGTTAFADQYFYADPILPTVLRSGLRAPVAWGLVEPGEDDTPAREPIRRDPVWNPGTNAPP